MYNDEEYTLQIDSHHRFIEHWDKILIEMLLSLKSSKPLITTYAPPYDPRTGRPLTELPSIIGFDRFTPEGGVSFRPVMCNQGPAGPVRARFYSAHFAFTRGEFCREVRHDPHVYFLGEEINITVRAFTHGYDLFHPDRPIVWHTYDREGRRKHWDDHILGQPDTIPWYVRDQASHRRLRLLLGMEPGICDFGEYGLGSRRTLSDYERYAGINFKLRLIQSYTNDNMPPPNPEVYSSDDEWLQSCCKDFEIIIDISNRFLPHGEDIDFWYVGVHDRDGRELHRLDLDTVGLQNVLSRPKRLVKFAYRATEPAHTWTIWPHSAARGWLEPITGSLEG